MYFCIYLHIYLLANSFVLFQVQVACHLFHWTKVMAYAYYYNERALTNGDINIKRFNDLYSWDLVENTRFSLPTMPPPPKTKLALD